MDDMVKSTHIRDGGLFCSLAIREIKKNQKHLLYLSNPIHVWQMAMLINMNAIFQKKAFSLRIRIAYKKREYTNWPRNTLLRFVLTYLHAAYYSAQYNLWNKILQKLNESPNICQGWCHCGPGTNCNKIKIIALGHLLRILLCWYKFLKLISFLVCLINDLITSATVDPGRESDKI